jgi:1,2-diacylglycerol 3-beta-galactosyltransferase
VHELLHQYPADVVVSVHPLINHWANWALAELGRFTPYVTVVTDLCTAHAWWYYPGACHILVPTAEARQRGIHFGVDPNRISVAGLPVGPQFGMDLSDGQGRAALRQKLGLDAERKVELLAGGGDGMGPLARVLRAADEALPAGTQVVVITGRNAALRSRLMGINWHRPVRVEGFVTNMAEWMAAADVLVTKAGPGTITEAMLSGLPVLLIDRLPGQEDGNVAYVTGQQFGAWEPNPRKAAARLAEWLRPDNLALAEMAARARQLAYPDGARTIAGKILELAANPVPGPSPRAGTGRSHGRGDPAAELSAIR